MNFLMSEDLDVFLSTFPEYKDWEREYDDADANSTLTLFRWFSRNRLMTIDFYGNGKIIVSDSYRNPKLSKQYVIKINQYGDSE